MKLLALGGGKGKGKFVKVDDEDYDRLSKHKWKLHKTGYAMRTTRVKLVRMHREVLNASGKQQVDHINNDKLDNQSSNLRFATQTQNCYNKTKQNGVYSSQYKGVYWSKVARQWQAYIHYQYKSLYLGLFPQERWAAMAYDIAARDLFGEFAKHNFEGCIING